MKKQKRRERRKAHNMLSRMDLNGNPHIGVYCRANNEIAFVPPFANEKEIREIKRVLRVRVVSMTIGGSSIIGSLLAMNSNGMVVADFIEKDEMKKIEENFDGEIMVIEDRYNASGNNILANDYGAIAHPMIKDETLKKIERILDVKAEKSTIAGLNTVGMAGVATNKGVLCHPKIGEEERKMIEDVLGVEVNIGTVNHGMPYVGAGIIANEYGAIASRNTTGIELGRIEEALNLG